MKTLAQMNIKRQLEAFLHSEQTRPKHQTIFRGGEET
jgi:hypothetical protein